MQGPPALAEQTTVRHLVGQRVLEGVLELGERLRLVEELRRLQVHQPTPQRFFIELGDAREQGEGHILADHRRRLEKQAQHTIRR
jgi:hypothetical protein